MSPSCTDELGVIPFIYIPIKVVGIFLILLTGGNNPFPFSEVSILSTVFLLMVTSTQFSPSG